MLLCLEREVVRGRGWAALLPFPFLLLCEDGFADPSLVQSFAAASQPSFACHVEVEQKQAICGWLKALPPNHRFLEWPAGGAEGEMREMEPATASERRRRRDESNSSSASCGEALRWLLVQAARERRDGDGSSRRRSSSDALVSSFNIKIVPSILNLLLSFPTFFHLSPPPLSRRSRRTVFRLALAHTTTTQTLHIVTSLRDTLPVTLSIPSNHHLAPHINTSPSCPRPR